MLKMVVAPYNGLGNIDQRNAHEPQTNVVVCAFSTQDTCRNTLARHDYAVFSSVCSALAATSERSLRLSRIGIYLPLAHF